MFLVGEVVFCFLGLNVLNILNSTNVLRSMSCMPNCLVAMNKLFFIRTGEYCNILIIPLKILANDVQTRHYKLRVFRINLI